MRIEVRGSDVEVSGALREHVERRLGFALGRFSGRLGAIAVRLADGGAPREGGRRCRIAVDVVPLKTRIIVEEADADICAAVARAADRIGSMVGRRLEAGRLRRWD